MKWMTKRKAPFKYRYLKTSTMFVKITNLIGLLASLFMISGLIILCINNFFFIPIFSPFILIFLFYYASHYGFNLFYNKSLFSGHEAFIDSFWKKGEIKPAVDIFITYSGEGINIVRETCLAALNIDYDNKNIFLLDDAGDQSIKNEMEGLGINYLCRPDRGHMKKAGNLTYAVGRTNGEFIAIFDSDFVPERDFLKELIPYFSDMKIGIIQSPQFFITQGPGLKKNILTSGGAALQEDFYKIIQTSRNPFHGAICVGTNLIYRRSSLLKSGGIAYVPWCEDLETGFNITASGYYLLYLPIILAKGRTPDNPQSYFNQHRRWCYSSLRLLFSRKMFHSKMDLSTRLSYLSNIFYYFSEAFSILAVLIFSIIMVFAGSLIDTRYFIFFLPYLIFLLVIQPVTRFNKISFSSYIVSALESFSYLYTITVMIITRELNWIPSNSRQGKISLHFALLVLFSGLIIAVETYNLLNISFLNLKIITFRQWTTYAFMAWFLIILFTQASLFIYFISFIIKSFLGRPKREV
jgi:cellulose synthase (UDP-forming)